MSFIVGVLALVLIPQIAAPSEGGASAVATDATVERTARTWLELIDQGRWADSYAATTASFRKLNTAKIWADTSEKVRTPLGAVRSRVLLDQRSVPAPPAGVEVVRYRTSFANKADATETVSLAREGGQWRVVGIYIE